MAPKLPLLAACTLCLGAHADERLEIRTGMWEIAAYARVTGSPPWSRELREKLTPEQRAELEAAFESVGKAPQTEVTLECITAEDLLRPFHSNTEGCTQTILRATRTSQEVQLACTGEYKGSGVLSITASHPQTLSATLDLRAGDGDNVMRVQSQMEGRWLSADCEEGLGQNEEIDGFVDGGENDMAPPEEYDEPEDESRP